MATAFDYSLPLPPASAGLAQTDARPLGLTPQALCCRLLSQAEQLIVINLAFSWLHFQVNLPVVIVRTVRGVVSSDDKSQPVSLDNLCQPFLNDI